MNSRRLLQFSGIAVSLAAFFVLTGCATGDVNDFEGVKLESKAAKTNLGPLLDAKDRTQITCTTTEPLSNQRPLNDIIFACGDTGARATLPELKDAGWRLIALDIGKDSQQADGTVTMPLKITIIKLF